MDQRGDPVTAGTGAAAQHSQSLEALFVHFPGLKVAMPSTPADAKGLLKAAIRDDNPVVFIEHKLLYNRKGPVPEGEHVVPLGQAPCGRELRGVPFLDGICTPTQPPLMGPCLPGSWSAWPGKTA